MGRGVEGGRGWGRKGTRDGAEDREGVDMGSGVGEIMK